MKETLDSSACSCFFRTAFSLSGRWAKRASSSTATGVFFWEEDGRDPGFSLPADGVMVEPEPTERSFRLCACSTVAVGSLSGFSAEGDMLSSALKAKPPGD
jgi:hypothetical protein